MFEEKLKIEAKVFIISILSCIKPISMNVINPCNLQSFARDIKKQNRPHNNNLFDLHSKKINV